MNSARMYSILVFLSLSSTLIHAAFIKPYVLPSIYRNMFLRYIIKNPHKKKQIAHIGASAVILIHAFDKYTVHRSGYELFLAAGLLFLTIAIFHPLIAKRLPWIDGVFFVIEGILSIVVAVEFLQAGKQALPLCYAFLGGFQFYMAFRKSKKAIGEHQSPNQPS
jgi:hypothetical protein